MKMAKLSLHLRALKDCINGESKLIIKTKLTKREEELLRGHDIVIDDHDYGFKELDIILEIVSNTRVACFTNNGYRSNPLYEEYCVLRDKIFEFCKAQYALENPE